MKFPNPRLARLSEPTTPVSSPEKKTADGGSGGAMGGALEEGDEGEEEEGVEEGHEEIGESEFRALEAERDALAAKAKVSARDLELSISVAIVLIPDPDPNPNPHRDGPYVRRLRMSLSQWPRSVLEQITPTLQTTPSGS